MAGVQDRRTAHSRKHFTGPFSGRHTFIDNQSMTHRKRSIKPSASLKHTPLVEFEKPIVNSGVRLNLQI